MAGLEDVTGAVVALDPSTGAILGMASTPTYDPNQLSSHDPAAIRAYREQLEPTSRDPRSTRRSAERYPPGSIFKVVVSAAALANGATRPRPPIPAPDLLTLPGTTTHGELRRRELQRRRRPAADRRADDLLQHRLRPARHRPRRGHASARWPRPSASTTRASRCRCRSRASKLGDIENDAQLGISSIGQQDVQLTPLQAAMIAAAVANDGTLMKPYLVPRSRRPTSPSSTRPTRRRWASRSPRRSPASSPR